MIIALILFCSVYILILMYKNAELTERVYDLETRIETLEKDAVKVTFSETFSSQDENNINE